MKILPWKSRAERGGGPATVRRAKQRLTLPPNCYHYGNDDDTRALSSQIHLAPVAALILTARSLAGRLAKVSQSSSFPGSLPPLAGDRSEKTRLPLLAVDRLKQRGCELEREQRTLVLCDIIRNSMVMAKGESTSKRPRLGQHQISLSGGTSARKIGAKIPGQPQSGAA